MSLTKKQEPNEIHSVFQNAYYTYQTNQTGVDNFYYLMYINDAVDGVVFAGNTAPLENKLSMNYPNEILKNKTYFNFNPSCSEIENIPENIYVYNESIREFNSTTGETFFNVKSACRYIDEDFVPEDYLINSNTTGSTSTTDFLVKMPNEHLMRYDDEFTLRTYNGYLDSDESDNHSLLQTIGINIHCNDEDYPLILARFKNENTYLAAAQSNTLSATTTGDNYMIEIGVGLSNLIGIEIVVYGVVDNNGDTIIFNNNKDETFNLSSDGSFEYQVDDDVLSVNIIVSFLDYYEIFGMYKTGKDYTQATLKHKFTFYDDCRFDSINIAWENSIGGVDYYLFTKANEKTIVTDKTTYEKNKYYLDVTNELVTELPYNPRTTVYNNKITTFIECQTDWLNQEEINGISGIFQSTNVYMYYGDAWVSVVSVEKKAVVYNKKRKGLKKYVLNFELSSKTIRS